MMRAHNVSLPATILIATTLVVTVIGHITPPDPDTPASVLPITLSLLRAG